jgi:putative CocE/NonD family hydrolase
MSSQGSQLRAMLRAKQALAPAFRHLPMLTADEVAVGRPVPFYRAWLEHEEPGDPYWTATDFRAVLPGLGIPVTMQAGWYDMFLPSMLADYRRLRDAGQAVRLRVSGWPHGSRRGAGYSLRDALAHYDAHLRHQPAPAAAPVRVEVMGGGGWRDLPDWPPPARTGRWHLQPAGTLAPAPPPESAPDRYRYDPADPTPAAGGSGLLLNAGPADNRALEARPDVLTYTSAPLPSTLEIIGPVTAELHVTSSLEHTDFFARLCDVHPRGRSVNVTDGLVRLRPGAPRPARIELWPTAHRFAPGHRIRLQVSSGAHPRYARNPGTGELLATATTLLACEQAVHHDPGHPSGILLPVITGG